jgi:ferric-dicitrate binding protein FerR (iron transport regulator)
LARPGNGRFRHNPPKPHRPLSSPSRSTRRARRRCDSVAELLALQAEYAAWSDALPDSLRDRATAEALQAIADLDLDDLAAIVPPRGHGRD